VTEWYQAVTERLSCDLVTERLLKFNFLLTWTFYMKLTATWYITRQMSI